VAMAVACFSPVTVAVLQPASWAVETVTRQTNATIMVKARNFKRLKVGVNI